MEENVWKGVEDMDQIKVEDKDQKCVEDKVKIDMKDNKNIWKKMSGEVQRTWTK